MGAVVLANDQGAVELARTLKEHLEKRGFSVNHLGVFTTDSVDYPDMAVAACTEYLKGGYEFGIVCCGTGIGISITANKFDGILCALPQNVFAASMAKRHNNANFIAFGGRVKYPEPVTEMLDAYIDSTFEGGRHTIRVNKMLAQGGAKC